MLHASQPSPIAISHLFFSFFTAWLSRDPWIPAEPELLLNLCCLHSTIRGRLGSSGSSRAVTDFSRPRSTASPDRRVLQRRRGRALSAAASAVAFPPTRTGGGVGEGPAAAATRARQELKELIPAFAGEQRMVMTDDGDGGSPRLS